MSLSVIIPVALLFYVAACTSPETARTRGGGPGADVGNLCRCTKAQDRLKILPKSFPPSILLWLPPVRPTTSAANDGN